MERVVAAGTQADQAANAQIEKIYYSARTGEG